MNEKTEATDPEWLASASLIAVIFINVLGFGIVVPLLPFYAASLDATPWQISLIFSAFAIGAFFGEPIWGRVSDRYGRKIILVSTVSANLLCYLALAWVSTIWSAFLIRLLSGLASGNGAVVQGYIADVSPPDARARQLSWLGAANAIGLVVGPSVGGVFVRINGGPAGFRIPFLMAASLSALCVLAIALFVREPPATARVQREHYGHWAALRTVSRDRVQTRLMSLTFLIGAGFIGIESIFGLWCVARFGWTPRTIGLCFAAAGASAGITQIFVTGPLSKRFGERRVLATGLLITACASVLQPYANGFLPIVCLLSLAALGPSVSFPNIAALLSRNTDRWSQGQVLGLNNAAAALSRVSGPFVAAMLFAHVGRNIPFLFGAFIFLMAIPLVLSHSRQPRA